MHAPVIRPLALAVRRSYNYRLVDEKSVDVTLPVGRAATTPLPPRARVESTHRNNLLTAPCRIG